MKSSVIFKNPDKPVNHKPMIAAGAVVAYNLLKSKQESSTSSNQYDYSGSSTSSKSEAMAAFDGLCCILCLMGPMVGVPVAAASPTAALFVFIAVACIYAISITRLLYVLIKG